MSSTPMRSEQTARNPNADKVDLQLEVVDIPVSVVDLAKRFYGNLEWRLDADFANEHGWRVVQSTPPG